MSKAAGAEEDEYEYESTSSSSLARRSKQKKEDRRPHGPRADESWPYLQTAAAVAPLVAAAMTSSMAPSPAFPPGNFNPLGYNGAYAANWGSWNQMYPSMSGTPHHGGYKSGQRDQPQRATIVNRYRRDKQPADFPKQSEATGASRAGGNSAAGGPPEPQGPGEAPKAEAGPKEATKPGPMVEDPKDAALDPKDPVPSAAVERAD